MVSKVLLGGLAAAVMALGIVFWLLMDAKEANGELVAGMDRVAAANLQQGVVIDFLQKNTAELIAKSKRNGRTRSRPMKRF